MNKREKILKKKKRNSLRDLWDNNNRSNIDIVGVLEGDKESG